MGKPTKMIVMRPIEERILRKPKRLINPKEVRAFILKTLKARRPALAHYIDRVSAESVNLVEGDLINAIQRRVDTMPSKGKTVKF